MASVVIKTEDCIPRLQESFNSATDLWKETPALLRFLVIHYNLYFSDHGSVFQFHKEFTSYDCCYYFTDKLMDFP